MKVIAENLITAVAAASEDAAYPDDNVLDEHPKKVWKAASGVTQAMILCSMSATSGTGNAGLAIFNTNAESVAVSVRDPNEISWEDNEWPSVVWQFVTPSVDLDVEQNGDSYAIWAEFDAQGAAVDIAVTLTAPSTVYAGVITAGDILTFKNPQYGIQQGLRNYSILAELSNGETYHKKRDVVRTFSGMIYADRDEEFYSFMHTIARDNSYDPMAWRLTDLDSFEWCVYARFEDMPGGAHTLPSHSTINFSLIEVL